MTVLCVVTKYEVEVNDTAAATRCELYGRYRLQLSDKHVSLLHPMSGLVVVSWLYGYELFHWHLTYVCVYTCRTLKCVLLEVFPGSSCTDNYQASKPWQLSE